MDEGQRWVYYPWRRAVVRLLGPRAFSALRLDRNHNKLTREEQVRLRSLRVGIVGVSAGHAIAHLLALEVVGHRVDAAPDPAHAGLLLRVGEPVEMVDDPRKAVGPDVERDLVGAEEE